MQKSQTPLVLGLAGGTGSGKTTVANAILSRVGQTNVSYLAHDAYYKDLSDLPKAQKDLVNFDHPDSLETNLMIEHIIELKKGNPIELPIYDFSIHTRTAKSINILPNPIILVEGILIFAEPELRELFDVKLFVDTDSDLRLVRRIRRDITERGRTIESVLIQYEETVRPMHLEFVEPSKRYADVIIPEGGYNKVALDMVTARIFNLINNK